MRGDIRNEVYATMLQVRFADAVAGVEEVHEMILRGRGHARTPYPEICDMARYGDGLLGIEGKEQGVSRRC